MFWSLVDIHPAQANTNGSGGDDDDSVACLLKLDRGVHDQGQDGQQGLMRLFIDD